MSMTLVSNQSAAIIRTERGLTIAGTRITLYDVMDYLTEQYPPKFIGAMLDLTAQQVSAALSYIQLVLKEAEALQQHYEVLNRDRFARIAAKPPKPGTEAIYAKLQARSAKSEAQA
jgi:uncharacterized protein (DUF433 family)